MGLAKVWLTQGPPLLVLAQRVTPKEDGNEIDSNFSQLFFFVEIMIQR